jgi:prepilin-type N-terminal cleavage/methylation domain-containing protein
MTKLLKNNKGFTLVEVIVVAVIVLILAAVAIPLYQGYMLDSRQATAENIGGTIVNLVATASQVQATSVSYTAATRTFALVGGTFGDGAEVRVPDRYVVEVKSTGVEVTPCNKTGTTSVADVKMYRNQVNIPHGTSFTAGPSNCGNM